jgi:hypothetical protein
MKYTIFAVLALLLCLNACSVLPVVYDTGDTGLKVNGGSVDSDR